MYEDISNNKELEEKLAKEAVDADVNMLIAVTCPICKHGQALEIPLRPTDHRAIKMTDEEIRQELHLDDWQDIPDDAHDQLFKMPLPKYISCGRCLVIIKFVYPDSLRNVGMDPFNYDEESETGFEDYPQNPYDT